MKLLHVDQEMCAMNTPTAVIGFTFQATSSSNSFAKNGRRNLKKYYLRLS